MSAIWSACRDVVAPGPVAGTVRRMVESQEEIATRALVDTLAEQAALERLLENSKPPRPPGTEHLHYLLATPFRYPPLRHGSRFGGPFEPSLFYGALGGDTLLMEASYYRFVFRAGLAEPFPSVLSTRHTAFEARFRAARGLRLEAPPFDAFAAQLRSPSDYQATQALGAALRAEGIEAFSYVSARDPSGGSNVALLTPAALASAALRHQSLWTCEAGERLMLWREQGAHQIVSVPIESFLVDGRLPQPAA